MKSKIMNSHKRSLFDSRIETASESDIPMIINVEEETWISSYPNIEAGITLDDVKRRFDFKFKKKRMEEIKSEMLTGIHCYKVIKEKGKVVAYSHLLQEKEFGDLVEVYVLPSHQRIGMGGGLIRDGLEWLRKDKLVRLEVAVYNPAIEIYKHYGFVDRLNLQQAEDEDWNILPSGKRIPIKFMERPVD